jgi:N-acetylglucosamine-6-phosphate deacetylase
MKQKIETIEKLAAELAAGENQTVHLHNAVAQLKHAAAAIALHVKKTETVPAEKTPAK